MSSIQKSTQSSDQFGKFVMLAAIAIVLTKAAFATPDMIERFVSGDNDDITRLVSVRNWQAGQDWFDMQQYRLLPPEGVSLHWSRFIDVGIASLIGLFAFVMSPENAEMWAVAFWPPLLMVAMIFVVSRGTTAILGARAGWIAVFSLLLWSVTGSGYFEPGRIDHHNVQILMTTIAGFAMISVGAPVSRGLIAGIASAFSLAVGLEGLFVIAVIGLTMLVWAAWDKPQAARLLIAFNISLFGGSILFFLAQTSPSDYAAKVCDELSLPILSIAGIAVVACLVPMVLRGRITSPAVRILLAGLITGIGVILARHLLAPCFVGPYGQLPLEAQALISSQIVEAWGALRIAREMPITFNGMVTPIAGAVATGAMVWYSENKRGALTPVQSSAVLQMLVIGALGLFGAMLQIRLSIMAAPAVGFLTGFVIATLLEAQIQEPSNRKTLLLFGAAIITLLAPALNRPIDSIARWQKGEITGANTESEIADSACRKPEVISKLNILPTARVFSSLNMGAPLLLMTHHFGLTAPYHRSADAFLNGIIPFRADEAGLRAAVESSKADILVICKDTQRNGFASELVQGTKVDWLEEIPDIADEMIVLAVRP